MGISCMHSVKFVKYTLQVLFLDTNAIILYLDKQVTGIVPSRYIQIKVNIIAFVLDSIIHKVEDDVGEVHLIYLYHGILCRQLGVYHTSALNHLDLECLNDTINQFVCI